jgi:hypothetical protein
MLHIKRPEQTWQEQALAIRAKAEKLPYGKEREALEMKARQLEMACQIRKWVTSPGLAAPT